MHELSLSESITDLVVKAARGQGIARVTRVDVAIGVAAAIETAALTFCFPITTGATLAAGAELVIHSVALKARCQSCQQIFLPENLIAACPVCSSHARTILEGREMRVISFEGE